MKRQIKNVIKNTGKNVCNMNVYNLLGFSFIVELENIVGRRRSIRVVTTWQLGLQS